MKRLLSIVAVPIAALSLASCGVEDSAKKPSEAAAAQPPVSTPDTTRDRAVEVPDVTGQAADDAQSSVGAVGKLTAAFDRKPEDPAVCTVASQDPEGGEKVDPGTEVTLSLDCGIKVPDVTGKGAEAAKSKIENAGDLSASYDMEPDDASVCTVSAQDPKGGTTVDAGTDVMLTLECEGGAGSDDSSSGGSDDYSDDGASSDDYSGGDSSGDEESSSCEPGYDPCLKAGSSDYDCEGGSGDGPDYTGPVTVTGSDRFDLDRDGDGSGCDG